MPKYKEKNATAVGEVKESKFKAKTKFSRKRKGNSEEKWE